MKKCNIIYLDSRCKKAAYCNREEYFKKYGQFSYSGDFKGMMKNAPIVINIGGTYYYVERLAPLFGSSAIRFEKFERELRDPKSSEKDNLAPPTFIWR